MSKGVVVYKDTDFRGKSKVLTEGRYNINEMGIDNDSLSSLRVDKGYQATLFEHDDYRGKSVIYTSDSPDVGKFNDKTSSIIVEKIPVCTIFERENYQGKRQNLKEGRYNLTDLEIGNDTLSSIRVKDGYTVTLYASRNYQGEKREYKNNHEYVGTFNDKASSIEVFKS